ncbi:Casein kinase II subunit beta [Leucoagaricus sp. SymC.cos]|nr:Casein kinase II subunit beta [Leucoagaricus sp. SymC.cos]
MIEKYKRADFGRCPRVLCNSQALLPVGLTDIPYEKSVKLYCGRCEDLYSPKSSRHGSIDGAYFGTTFSHLLFLVYPNLIPPKNGPADFGGPSNNGTTTSSGAVGGGVGGAGGAGAGVLGSGVGVPGLSGVGGGLGGVGGDASGRIRRNRVREEPEMSEGGGEQIVTSNVALKAERYRPKIYGFQVHEIAKLQRWQEAVRDRQVARLDALEEVKKM